MKTKSVQKIDTYELIQLKLIFAFNMRELSWPKSTFPSMCQQLKSYTIVHRIKTHHTRIDLLCISTELQVHSTENQMFEVESIAERVVRKFNEI